MFRDYYCVVISYNIFPDGSMLCSASEREISWLGQTKQTRGWQHFMGAPGWASGMELRHEAFLTEVMNREKQGRQNREKTGNGWGLGEKGKGNTENPERSPCSQSWRWDLRMAKSASIRLVHMN